MNTNPFFDRSLLDGPLQQEFCQRIHYEALISASRGQHTEELPATVNLTHLRQRARAFGRDSYLIDPRAIAEMFTGVTLAVYKTIEALYCSRLERRIGRVWRIINAMASQSAATPIAYEAVWAICIHLDEQRARMTDVTVELLNTTWWVTYFLCDDVPEELVCSRQKRCIICVVENSPFNVLAFGATDGQPSGEDYASVLYDAIVLQRRPHRHGKAGLVWRVPKRLIVEEALPQEYRQGCTSMGMVVEESHGTLPCVQHVQENWIREYTVGKLRADRWAEGFDSYLQKVYGASPLRKREQLDREFGQRVGYSSDPSWLFPALRSLLPERAGYIQDGTVSYDGLHYEDDLLSYWSGSSITLRRSAQTEACIWVYLHSEILCQAMARELRRLDGSYRPHRPGR